MGITEIMNIQKERDKREKGKRDFTYLILILEPNVYICESIVTVIFLFQKTDTHV